MVKTPGFSGGKKVVIVGNSGVGKTSIICKYLDRTEISRTTVGASSFKLSIPVNGKSINFAFWDTAGQENYKSLVPVYARGATIAIITFSLVDPNSFEAVPNWLSYLRDDIGVKNFVLVGNKSDLESTVPLDIIQDFSHKEHIPIVNVSAVTGENVDMLFYNIASAIFDIEKNGENPVTIKRVSPLLEYENKAKSSDCC